MKKGSSKRISVVKWVVPQSWGTSNGTFVTDRVGDIEISFVDYLASKKVRLWPDIAEYSPGDLSQLRSNIRLFDYRCLFPIIYDWVSHVKLNIHAPEMD
jgi:hypothetical protein